jgi:selenoprotein W-related protein
VTVPARPDDDARKTSAPAALCLLGEHPSNGSSLYALVVSSPRVEIRYCPKCGWLLRAAWMAQELLSTFSEELAEVALVPSSPGTYEIWVGQELLFSRRVSGGFPEVKALKQALRDRVAPGRSLGHVDC